MGIVFVSRKYVRGPSPRSSSTSTQSRLRPSAGSGWESASSGAKVRGAKLSTSGARRAASRRAGRSGSPSRRRRWGTAHPSSAPGEQPVPQAVLGRPLGQALLRQPRGDPRLRLVDGEPVDVDLGVGGVDHHSGARVRGVLVVVGRRLDRPDVGQTELLRELPVAGVLGGHSHDRAGAVAHEDVVGDEDRNLRPVAGFSAYDPVKMPVFSRLCAGRRRSWPPPPAGRRRSPRRGWPLPTPLLGGSADPTLPRSARRPADARG